MPVRARPVLDLPVAVRKVFVRFVAMPATVHGLQTPLTPAKAMLRLRSSGASSPPFTMPVEARKAVVQLTHRPAPVEVKGLDTPLLANKAIAYFLIPPADSAGVVPVAKAAIRAFSWTSAPRQLPAGDMARTRDAAAKQLHAGLTDALAWVAKRMRAYRLMSRPTDVHAAVRQAALPHVVQALTVGADSQLAAYRAVNTTRLPASVKQSIERQAKTILAAPAWAAVADDVASQRVAAAKSIDVSALLNAGAAEARRYLTKHGVMRTGDG